MATTPPPDLLAALRAALPPELHHLVEPLARYVEASVALGTLTADPATASAVACALESLQGTAVMAPSGLLAFGTGSQLGDVTVSNLAGGNIANISVTLPAPSPSLAPMPIIPHIGLSPTQMDILITLECYLPGEFIPVRELANIMGADRKSLYQELDLLIQLYPTLLTMEANFWGKRIRIDPEGRQFARTLIPNNVSSP